MVSNTVGIKNSRIRSDRSMISVNGSSVRVDLEWVLLNRNVLDGQVSVVSFLAGGGYAVTVSCGKIGLGIGWIVSNDQRATTFC